MPLKNLSISLQSTANKLRSKLLKGADLSALLDIHQWHLNLVEQLSLKIDLSQLSLSERFAWKFIREINILSGDFSQSQSHQAKFKEISGKDSKTRQKRLNVKPSKGIHQDLQPIVQSVRDIWFPEMRSLPKIMWLKKFSTRKLAHYARGPDEIAYSLIFDFPEVPAEIMSYLAYHELLHRNMGAKRINNRQFAHTPDFKDRERLFPNWKNIDKTIEAYILTTV